MGLYETRVVEGMPEKISSPRWPARTREVKYLIIRCLKWTPKVRQKTCGVHFTNLSTFIKFESSYNAELALVKLMKLFNHSNVAITKRYLGLRQEEILQTYDCLSFWTMRRRHFLRRNLFIVPVQILSPLYCYQRKCYLKYKLQSVSCNAKSF